METMGNVSGESYNPPPLFDVFWHLRVPCGWAASRFRYVYYIDYVCAVPHSTLKPGESQPTSLVTISPIPPFTHPHCSAGPTKAHTPPPYILPSPPPIILPLGCLQTQYHLIATPLPLPFRFFATWDFCVAPSYFCIPHPLYIHHLPQIMSTIDRFFMFK